MTEREAADGGEGEILKASSPGADVIDVGMEVKSIDGEVLGHVKEVRSGDFLLERPFARDLFVPFDVVLATPHQYEKFRGGPTQPTEVVLSITSAHIDQQGWPHT
jgi:hypothetical protein